MRWLVAALAATPGEKAPPAPTPRRSLADLEDDLEAIEQKEKSANDAELQVPNASDAVVSDKIIDDWVKYMEDYESNTLVSYVLSARHEQVFYEHAEQGQLVRGAFFASKGEEASDIGFSIYSPGGGHLFDHTGVEAIFHFRAKETGDFKFATLNPDFFSIKSCTFTVGVSTTEKVASHVLGPTHQKIQDILHVATDAQIQSKYLWKREAARLQYYNRMHYRVINFAILNFCVYAAVSAFQIYYIKGILSDRRVL